MIYNAPSAAVEAVLDRHGVTDPGRRHRIHREAQHRLEARAGKAVLRVLTTEAMGQGWAPPLASDVPEVPSNFPVPIRQEVYCRVVGWVRQAPGEFSVRDVMRASNFFDKAVDARAVVDGLLVKGEIEALEPDLRWPGDRGRPPGPRYRAVRGGKAVRIPTAAPDATRNNVEVEELDWSFLDSDKFRQ